MVNILQDQKRKLMIKVGDKTPETEEIVRLESISRQISSLVIRGDLVKNSVLSFVIAIALFVFTSLLIGVLSLLTIAPMNFLIIVSFLLGMIAVFTGTVFMGLEVKHGYKIILFEVKAHE